MIGKVTCKTPNPPCRSCGGMAGYHSKDCGFNLNELHIATIEEMITELEAAGWTKHSATVWLSPRGGYYRGPFGAWKAELDYRKQL